MSAVARAFSRAASLATVADPSSATGAAAAPAPMRAPARSARDPLLATLGTALACALTVLMTVPDSLDYAALATGGAPVAGGTVTRLIWLALLGMSLAVIVLRRADAAALARHFNPFLPAFALLAAASVLWSIEPPLTARRLIRLATILAVACAWALSNWPERKLQDLLRPLLTAVLAASLVFGLVRPDLAIHPESDGLIAGAWRGIANHKNGLGELACLGALLWLHAGLGGEVRGARALAGLALAVTVLILSRSSTALVTLLVCAPFLLLLMRTPRGLQQSLPLMVALAIGLLLLYTLVLLRILPGLHTLLGPIGALTGKDLTFTGRSDIWDLMFEQIALHPGLGGGFGAFWSGTREGTPSFEFVMRLGFDPASAHNGYLDILNELGAAGLLLLFGYLVLYVVQSLRLLGADRAAAALLLVLFLQQALTNLAESRWFSPLSVDFVIMTLATASLAQAVAARRGARA